MNFPMSSLLKAQDKGPLDAPAASGIPDENFHKEIPAQRSAGKF